MSLEGLNDPKLIIARYSSH